MIDTCIFKYGKRPSPPTDTDNLIALARLYGITLDELISGTGTATPVPPGNADDPLPNGSYFEHKAQQEQQAQEQRRRSFPYPVVVVFAYLLLGFECGLWHPGWVIFLLIPVLNAAAR